VNANQRKRRTRWSQQAQATAPAAVDPDRCALPQQPGGEPRPTDAHHGTWERSHPVWPLREALTTGAGANRMASGEGFLKKPRPGGMPRRR
jgi:hypothetical protein